MSREDVANFIKNEITQLGDTKKNTDNSQETPNKYERFMEKLFDKVASIELGSVVSVDGIKKLTKAAYNFCLKLESWAVKNDYGQGQVLYFDELGKFIDNSKDLTKRYDLLTQISDKCPHKNKEVFECVEKLAMREENNAQNIQQVFSIYDKIKISSPELSAEIEKSKAKVFQNLCMNNPQEGLMASVNLLVDKYPNEDDLKIGYAGIKSLLKSSKMKARLYSPLVKILKICSKSGYNEGKIGKVFDDICMDLHAKDKGLKVTDLMVNKNRAKENAVLIEQMKSKSR